MARGGGSATPDRLATPLTKNGDGQPPHGGEGVLFFLLFLFFFLFFIFFYIFIFLIIF
jgi:hypothetical protein